MPVKPAPYVRRRTLWKPLGKRFGNAVYDGEDRDGRQSTRMIGAPTFPDLSTLIVDESLYVRRILRDMLGRVGLRRTLEAPDGAEALGQLAESKPDIAVVDWNLSILSGEEFIRLTRASQTSPHPSIPIILMISKPTRPMVDRALGLGVNEIIAKPFSPKTLWSRLDEVINRPRPYHLHKGMLRPALREPLTMGPR